MQCDVKSAQIIITRKERAQRSSVVLYLNVSILSIVNIVSNFNGLSIRPVHLANAAKSGLIININILVQQSINLYREIKTWTPSPGPWPPNGALTVYNFYSQVIIYLMQLIFLRRLGGA